MGALRFLFAPELTRSLTDAVRSSAELVQEDAAVSAPGAGQCSTERVHETRKGDPVANRPKVNRPRLTEEASPFLYRPSGLLAGAVFIGIGIAGLLLSEPAAAQTIDRGLFADADRATRDVLAFLGDIGAGRSSVLGDMLFVFNGGVLALAGFLLVWHTVAGARSIPPARAGSASAPGRSCASLPPSP